MYIETVPNRNSPPAILLREGWREGKKTHKRTLTNISDWPQHKIETLRRLLKDELLVSPEDLFNTERTLPHGHVEVILGTIRKLGLESIISSKPCRERNLVVAMIVERLIHPCSKLATTSGSLLRNLRNKTISLSISMRPLRIGCITHLNRVIRF